MTDRELLELAAKAAGYTIEVNGHDINGYDWYWCHQIANNWNPLTNDGDALRLAVKVGLLIGIEEKKMLSYVAHEETKVFAEVPYDDAINFDPYAATRMAIVLAAAEIGKEME